MACLTKERKASMSATMTKRRQVRLYVEHDEALVAIARRRGCDVVDLFREAIIAHFSLPTEESKTFLEQETEATPPLSTGEDGVSEKEGAADKGIRGNGTDG